MDDFKDLKFMRLDKQVARVEDGEILKMIRGRRGYQRSKTQFHVDYINLTDKVLYVKNRMGLVESIQPELYMNDIRLYTVNDLANRGVLISIELNLTEDSARITMDSLKKHVTRSTLSANLYDRVKLAHSRLLKANLGRKVYAHIEGEMSVEVKLQYFISESTLTGADKYFSELDVTLSLFDRGEEVFDIEHPNTQDKLVGGPDASVDFWHKESSRSDKSLNLSLSVVDQTGSKTVGDRYIHLLGKVYKVPIIYKPPVNDERFVGLLVERNYSSLSPTGEKIEEYEVLQYTLDQAQAEFGLSRTVEAAHDAMDPRKKVERERERYELESHARKVELEESKDELLRSQQELMQAKARIEADQLQIKALTEKYRLDTALQRSRTDRREATVKEFTGLMTATVAIVGTAVFVYEKMKGVSRSVPFNIPSPPRAF